jgi:hypothetical protein
MFLGIGSSLPCLGVEVWRGRGRGENVWLAAVSMFKHGSDIAPETVIQ